MSRRHTVVAAVLVLFALGAGRAGTVSAHAELVSSSPENGAALETVPAQVELVFSENVGNPAALSLLAPDGSELSTGDLAVIGDTMTRRVDPGAGAAGAYTISYQVTSADGHPISGTIGFSVGDAGGAGVPAPTGSSSDPTDASPGVVAALAAAVAVALAVAVLATRRMLTDPGDTDP